MKAIRSLALALAWPFAAQAIGAPVGPNLFIAGDGFTLEQALADAAAQRTPMDPPTYKVLITGNEAERVIASRASREIRDVLAKARKGGARFFVCGKDLEALGAMPRDVLPGVRAVRGYVTAGMPAWERKLPPAPDRKSLAVCSNR